MELKTKYQYTYFIHPYVIKESRYIKYILKLIKDKSCNLKFFEKQRDLDMYTYFLPEIRNFMFLGFSFNKSKIKKLEEMDIEMQATLLAKYPCIMFEYNIGKDAQGKVGKENGIFFKIQKIEIICFNTGICFLNLKTNIEESNKFSDILDFNYKFRDINSEFTSLKEFENIKIQTDTFENIKSISEFVEEITGPNLESVVLNLDTERFLTYSYTCIEQEYWNDKNKFDEIEHEFFKYSNVLPNSNNDSFNINEINKNIKTISKWKYIRCGFTKQGSALLTSGINTTNYTKLPFSYENEYLYTYIFILYKKIYLKKINLEFKRTNNPEKVRKQFVKFMKELWVQEITNDDTGSLMCEKWKEALELDKIYLEIKTKYDVIYKELNIEKTARTNKIIAEVLLVSLIFNIIGFFILLKLY